jgi:hypothetical protein
MKSSVGARSSHPIFSGSFRLAISPELPSRHMGCDDPLTSVMKCGALSHTGDGSKSFLVYDEPGMSLPVSDRIDERD